MKIFLLDNFDSFTFNLVDYFEQLGCEVQVFRNDVDPAKIAEVAPDLIVLSPGPSVPANAGNMMKIIEKYHRELPIFGVCLGHEGLIEFFGGSLKFVEPMHGKSSPITHDGRGIFAGLEQEFMAGRYHSLCADEVPDCLEISANCGDLVMAVRHKELPIVGVQFHPESVLTMKNNCGFRMIENLVFTEIERFLRASIEGRLTVEEQVEFLENYTPDKVRAEDLAEFARFMNKEMTASLNMPGAIDVCGTGGSGLPRINTSTISAFLLSELGVGVAKHGNKAASGRFGSFDLLEELGVGIDKGPEQLERDYREQGRAFIYARNFHPVMRHFAEARSAIAKPTIFNILGPLLSPAAVERQIIGTSFEEQMRLIAEACRLMGRERVMVVRGSDGLDEVTLSGPTRVVELRDGEISEYEIAPEDFGVSKAEFAEFAGGDKEFNVNMARAILANECDSRHVDLVRINAALALVLAGRFEDLREAYAAVCKVGPIDYSENILKKIAATKVLPPSDRDFLGALKADGVSVIAEIKMASPSAGDIVPPDASAADASGADASGADAPRGDVAQIATTYEAGGASAISVLTDEKYFKGGFENLRKAREATSFVPLLCKDFIIQEYQIFKAREYGADAILLIVALLPLEQLKHLIAVAESLGMDALVEVHDEDEMEVAVKAGAKIIGVNNRDLRDFSIDLDTTNRLAEKCPDNIVLVSESGINSRADIGNLNTRVDAVLVGTALMGAKDIKSKLHELTA